MFVTISARTAAASVAACHSGTMQAMPRPPRAAGRRLRLRRRRPDRPARAARLAARRGLRLPRRHRALSLRRAHARTSCRSSRRDRRPPARARRQAARGRLQRGQLGGARAARASTSPHDGAGRRRDRRASRRPPSSPSPAAAPAGSACWRRPATVASGAYERAVRGADPHVHLESVACPDLAPIIQGGFPFDERVVETVRAYCAPLREAEVDTRDPRLHPLPAGRADAPADARARRDAGHLGRRRRRGASSARWRRAGC